MINDRNGKVKKILVLGGYGNFGKRIVENISNIKGISILVAGRNLPKSQAFIDSIKRYSAAKIEPCVIDLLANNFEARLADLSPDIIVHTGGPFQGQDYRVAEACVHIGAHYVDLADDRRFVCDINKLDDLAKTAGVLLVSGASSVPGLSSAVIENYQAHFATINSIDIAIAPGNKAERGEATVRGILSNTGHAFSVFKDGQWQDVFGWMDPRRNDFGDIIGKRWLANVDVPDLELFPKLYGVTNKVRFQAGLELPFLHLSMVGMAYLTKISHAINWSSLTRPIISASNLLLSFGSDNGAMQVIIEGIDNNNTPKTIKWTLYAPDGAGPYIPTLSAIIIIRKMLSESTESEGFSYGATACIKQFNLESFLPYFNAQGIYFKEDISGQTGLKE